ncbi:MAG: hypothetical protein ACQEQV_05630 [Fibrobacterota bacterium]
MRVSVIIAVFMIVCMIHADGDDTLSCGVSSDSLQYGGDIHIMIPKLSGDSLSLSDSVHLGGDPLWPVDTVRVNGDGRSVLTVQPLALGQCTIPDFSVQYPAEKDGKEYLCRSGSVTVLPARADTSHVPQPAGKIPAFAGFPWQYAAALLAGAAAVIILVWLLVSTLFSNRGKKNAPVPDQPPFEEFTAALQTISREGYLSRGAYRDCTFLISSALKRYLGRVYGVPLQESTAREFRAWLDDADMSGSRVRELKKFIRETEPVKFAHVTPPPESVQGWMDLSRAVAEQTEAERRAAAESAGGEK